MTGANYPPPRLLTSVAAIVDVHVLVTNNSDIFGNDAVAHHVDTMADWVLKSILVDIRYFGDQSLTFIPLVSTNTKYRPQPGQTLSCTSRGILSSTLHAL